jgi:hypothetical protein
MRLCPFHLRRKFRRSHKALKVLRAYLKPYRVLETLRLFRKLSLYSIRLNVAPWDVTCRYDFECGTSIGFMSVLFVKLVA